MSRKPRLNDLHLILLATAHGRDHGSILPVSDALADQRDQVAKAIPLLLKHALITEAPVSDRRRAWREEDQQPIGLVITAAGRKIIAAEDVPAGDATGPVPAATGPGASDSTARAASPVSPRSGSKIETVIGLLRRDEGATLAALVEATGWLPHTTRAALTGLRKKGHAIARSTHNGASVYQLPKVEA